jgi:hypothetical protein
MKPEKDYVLMGDSYGVSFFHGKELDAIVISKELPVIVYEFHQKNLFHQAAFIMANPNSYMRKF